jgi:PAS domain-containing protein
MILFEILIFFCLISSFTACALGFYVYGRNPESRVNRLFLFSMIGASYWAVGEFFFWLAPSALDAEFWLKFSSFWPVVIALFTHFILTYIDHPLTRPKKNRLLVAVLYIPALFFSLVNLCTDATFYVATHDGTTFIYVPNVSSALYQLETLFVLLIMIGAIWAGVSAWQRADSPRKQKHVRIICLALGTAIGFGAISGILFPLLDIQTPNFVFIGMFFFSLIITGAISRYGLFTLTPETALPEILNTMPDSMILTSMDGQILSVNASATRTFRTDAFSLQGQPATGFLPEVLYQELAANVREHGTVLDFEMTLDSPADATMSVAGSLVKEPDGSRLGWSLSCGTSATGRWRNMHSGWQTRRSRF